LEVLFDMSRFECANRFGHFVGVSLDKEPTNPERQRGDNRAVATQSILARDTAIPSLALFEVALFLSSEGALDCSHGWSEAQPVEINQVPRLPR
jgi:hypothetical protein